MRANAITGVAFVVIGIVIAACVGSDSTPGGSSSGSAGDDAGDGGASSSSGSSSDGAAVSPPAHVAASVFLADSDVTTGKVDGKILVGKAADESDVDSYVVYWGVTATNKLPGAAAVVTATKTGKDLTIPVTATVPTGATKLLVFTANAAGEMTIGIATDADNYPVYADISASAGGQTGAYPSAVIDTTGSKLLVVTAASGGVKPALFRCNLDGSGCETKDVSAGQSEGRYPRAQIDTKNGKLLVVAEGPKLFICGLDGTGCSYVDLAAGAGQGGAVHPSVVLDTTNDKLLVAAESSTISSHLGLYRCNVDGGMCGFIDLSAKAGVGANTGRSASAAIDTTNQKLLVATEDANNKPLLFVCALDGSSCEAKDISVGQGNQSGDAPSLVIDPVAKKALVVASNSITMSGQASLYACALDGTGCTHHDLTSGRGAGACVAPAAVIDTIDQKLLVTCTANLATGTGRLALCRSELDGNNAIGLDINGSRPDRSGVNPSAVLDIVNHRLRVAVDDYSNSERPALFSLGLW